MQVIAALQMLWLREQLQDFIENSMTRDEKGPTSNGHCNGFLQSRTLGGYSQVHPGGLKTSDTKAVEAEAAAASSSAAVQKKLAPFTSQSVT